MQAVFRNTSARTRKTVTDNGHTTVGLLTVDCPQVNLKEEGSKEGEEMTVYRFSYSITVLLKGDVRDTADSEGTER